MFSGCEINIKDDIGYSPLHLAAEHGYINLMEILLKHDAIVNFNDPNPTEVYPMDLVDEPLRLAIKVSDDGNIEGNKPGSSELL